MTPGVQMHPPEAATTVRVQDGYCGAKLDAQVLGQPFKPLGGGLLLEVPRY